jgi:arylsulfatase A-like enzyme
MKNNVLLMFGIFLALSSCKTKNDSKINETKEEKPNIVFIYFDDLGYGDVSAYGATELQTPNIDRLANEGLKFTNGYASSATCSPSRYALLTGSYPWRNENAKILAGDAPLLIGVDQPTLPKMLQKEGYKTAVVGKWHIGLGTGSVNWNEQVKPGPNEVGFDYSYIMAATQDRVPTVYLKDGFVQNLDPSDPIEVSYKENFEGEPTGYDNPELVTMKADKQHNKTVINGVPRIGFMKGGESARWSDIDMADHFLGKAQDYVKEQAQTESPFFLYYAFQQPHVPRTPHPRFEGATELGPRGDAIAEADWMIGEFIKTLEEQNLMENTIIVLSSDNGPILDDGYEDQAVELLGDHTPSGIYRGGKYSLFEAGTRVPFIVYWKDKVNAGVSDALVSQIDLFNSLSKLVGSEIKTEDGKELLDVFLGKESKGRESYIIEAMSRTAYKEGNWVMIPPYKGPKKMWGKDIETGNSPTHLLFNLEEDPSQENNLANEYPEKLAELIQNFEAIRGEGYKQTAAPNTENP